MISNTNVFNAAKLLFDQRGAKDAVRIASDRMALLRDIGDPNAEGTWVLITAAVQKLGRTERRQGETLH